MATMMDPGRSAAGSPPAATGAADGAAAPAVAGSAEYVERRAWIGEYFDRTAASAWRALTSEERVSKVRETVRAGRDRMRRTLLSYLPDDLAGWRVLDAGCGTGMLAVDLAQRGAEVVAIDLSPTLVGYGRERAEQAGVADRIAFHAGDMLDPSHGSVDAVVAMDSLIHYDLPQIVGALDGLAARSRGPIVVTVAPWTPLLGTLIGVQRLFPRRDRAPRIVPTSSRRLSDAIGRSPALGGWTMGRSDRIEQGFYRSQAYELRPATPATPTSR